MSKEQCMKFGQIVRIHGHRLGDENQSKRGMIVAKGFTDPDARYTTFQTFRNCQFYRQSLFQVLPKGIFQTSSESPTKQEQKKIIENYEIMIAQKMGSIIKFGQDVVFKHVDSQQYLSGSVRCSQGGLGAFKIQLTHELQKNLVFKMYPFRSFEKQGDPIKLQSPLRIKNMENRCYISTEKGKVNTDPESPTKHEIERQTVLQYNIVTTYSQSYTWLFHLHESEQTLKDTEQIKTHDIILLRYTKNQGYLCLDRARPDEPLKAMVRLPLENTGHPCYTCLWQIQKQPIPAISPYPDKKLGTQQTYTLRDLLTAEYLKVLPFQKQHREKRDVVGKTFDTSKLDEDEITIKSAKGMTKPDDFIKNNGLVKISGPKQVKLIKGGGQIDVEGQFLKNQQQFNFRQKQPAELWEVRFLSGDGEHGFRIEKIDQSSKQQVLFILSTYEVLDQFGVQLQQDTASFQRHVNAKRFDFIDELLKKLIVFIKQCNPHDIQQDTLPNKKKQFIAKDLKICDKLFKIVKHMGTKILDQIYKKEKSENQAFKRVFNRAYYLILQIIKENPITKLYVCEDWLDIILNHAIQNQEERVHETLNQILQSNELVVTKFLSVNDCHLIARIINVFTLKPPHQKFLNIFRASCMSNGSPIVTNQKLILDYFFKKLDIDASFTFVKVKGAQGMSLDVSPDQTKLYLKCSISKDQNRLRTLKDFFEESSRLDLSQTSNYFISYLNLLADICYGRNTQAKTYVQSILAPDTRQYFQDQDMRLIGGQVQKFDALYTLNYILQDKEIEQVKGYKNLLRAVLRVINYAFVQSADQNPVLRIKRYRNIDRMQKQEDGQSGKFEKLKSVMNFVKERIQNFKSFYDQLQDDQDFKKQQDKEISQKAKKAMQEQKKIRKKERQISSLQDKQFLLTQLILLKSTLIIGYWKVQQQQQLLPILLKVLTNSKKTLLHNKESIDTVDKEQHEFQVFKMEARRFTPTVQLITSCKALVCQLIEIIFDFRHDDLVTKCVGVYKEMSQRFMVRMGGHQIIMDDELNIDRGQDDDFGPQIYNTHQWKQRLAKIFDNKNADKQSENSSDNQVLIPLMIELGIHKNPNLFYRSLLILKRFFQYRDQILRLFLNLSLYNSESGEYLENQISKKRKELNTLQEENLLYAKDKVGVYDNIMGFLVWLSEAIKIDFHLEQRPNFKKFKCLFDHFNQKSQVNQFRQSTIKNMDLHRVLLKFLSLSRQSLSTYSDDARTVLKYVYRFLALLCKGYSQAKMEIYQTDKMTYIIKKHIKQEVQLVKNNDIPDTKAVMVEDLKKRDDCEAIQLLAELYSHNKFILFNEQQIQQTCQQICEMVNELNLNNYYKSHLLDFYRSLIYFRDQKISINQSRILAKLQDPKKQRIYYRVREPTDEDSTALIQYIKNLLGEFQDQNSLLRELLEPGIKTHHSEDTERDLIISPELTYFITLFNLFANLVQGKHIVNIGKGRQVHSYQMLMTILKFAKICYPLKTTIRSYINQLYYSTQIEQDLYNLIIKLELPLMIEDMNTLIIILIKDIETKYSIVHPVRYRYYETYIFLYVEQILLSLNYLFCEHESQFFRTELKKQLSGNYSRGYYYLHYFIIRIYERLRWLTEKYYQHNYFRGLLNMISNKIRIQFLEEFKKSALRIFDRDQEKKHEIADYNPTKIAEKQQLTQRRQDQLKKRCNMYLHKLVKGQIGDFYIKDRIEKNLNFPLTFTLPYEEKGDDHDVVEIQKKQKQMQSLAHKLKMMLFPNLREAQVKVNHNLRLQTLSEQLNDKISFSNFLQAYTLESCKQLYAVDQYQKKNYKSLSPFVTFSEYIQIFVQVNSEKPESITNSLRIFFFQLILWYIKKQRRDYLLENKDLYGDNIDLQIAKPIESWVKQDWYSVESTVKENQKFLAEAQVAELIISSLKQAEDLGLYAAIFQFCIAYLIGGNSLCQNTIYEKLKEDQKNSVFIKIEKLIARLGKRITSRISERTNRIAPAQDQFVVQPLDQYDYYDPSIKGMKKFESMSMPNKEEEDEERLQKQVFGMIFKFLQLLCECNNIPLKNFVRRQINTNGEKKSYSFNLINVAIFQIRRLFKVMHKEASGVIGPLIDFVNEVVTIPCIDNQRSLCETTFFDDLCYMASFFSDNNNVTARGFGNFKDKDFQPLNNIYKQCILIILNVLEASDSSLLKDLLGKMKARFLLDIVKRNLIICNIKSKEDFYAIIGKQIQINPRVPTKIQESMNVLIVLEKLQASEGSQKFKQEQEAYYAELQKSHDEDNIALKDLVKCIRQQMLKIQITSHQIGKQLYIYFPNHPILKTLSPTTRDRIMFEVSRSSQRQKIRSLFSFRQQILEQIKHNFQIQQQKLIGIIPYKPANILQLQQILFNLSFVINIIWIYSTEIIIEYSEITYLSPTKYKYILYILDALQLIITTLYFLSYYKSQYKLALFRAKKAEQEEQEKKEEEKQQSEQFVQGKMSVSQKIIGVLQIPVTYITLIFSYIMILLKNSAIGILFRFDSKFSYVFMYLLASIFGTFYSQTIFLCYVLFFFMKNDTLSNVFNAIVYNFGQLVSVGMLGFVFLYVFCLVFYETYSIQIMSQAGDDACYTIYGCLLDLFVSGTIGGEVSELQFWRFITDLIYFIFFGLLFGSIVSGIMLNTFAELRKQRDDMNDDKKNRCYICGKDRANLQKNNQNFEQHITGKHFLWNYIFYTYCLEEKHETEYSGLEYQINNCLKSGQGEEENKIRWIPFQTEAEDNYTQKINELEETMLNLTQTTKSKIQALKARKSQSTQGDEALEDESGN